MAHTTPRLGLSEIDGPDAVSSYPTAQNQAIGILDNAALFIEGILSARPSASPDGRVFYATDTHEYFIANGSQWDSFLGTPTVTALPGSPFNGQVVSFLANPSAGVDTVVWTLKYRAASTSAYKWDFVGGAPIFVEIPDQQGTTALVTYGDLATLGPTVTLPALPTGGDFMVEVGAYVRSQAGGNAINQTAMSYDAGPGAHDDDAAYLQVPGARTVDGITEATQITATVSSTRRKKGLVSGQTITAKYKMSTTGGNYFAQWGNRYLQVTPIRVG